MNNLNTSNILGRSISIDWACFIENDYDVTWYVEVKSFIVAIRTFSIFSGDQQLRDDCNTLLDIAKFLNNEYFEKLVNSTTK